MPERRFFYGQRASNIEEGTDLVVYTAAIHEDNPELAAAKAAGIPTLTRAELLGQIMDNDSDSVAIGVRTERPLRLLWSRQIF